MNSFLSIPGILIFGYRTRICFGAFGLVIALVFGLVGGLVGQQVDWVKQMGGKGASVRSLALAEQPNGNLLFLFASDLPVQLGRIKVEAM